MCCHAYDLGSFHIVLVSTCVCNLSLDIEHRVWGVYFVFFHPSMAQDVAGASAAASGAAVQALPM
jgi:hypothetical protein